MTNWALSDTHYVGGSVRTSVYRRRLASAGRPDDALSLFEATHITQTGALIDERDVNIVIVRTKKGRVYDLESEASSFSPDVALRHQSQSDTSDKIQQMRQQLLAKYEKREERMRQEHQERETRMRQEMEALRREQDEGYSRLEQLILSSQQREATDPPRSHCTPLPLTPEDIIPSTAITVRPSFSGSSRGRGRRT